MVDRKWWTDLKVTSVAKYSIVGVCRGFELHRRYIYFGCISNVKLSLNMGGDGGSMKGETEIGEIERG